MTPLPPAYLLTLGFTAGFLACVSLWLFTEWLEARRNAKRLDSRR